MTADHGTVNHTPLPDQPLPPRARELLASFIPADQIIPVEMKWTWFPFLPAGSLTLLEGDPGLGKSTITCSVAADLSQGRALPGDDPRPPMRIAMLSTEDLAEAIIIKRLIAHDANLRNIVVSNKGFAFDATGMATLAALMRDRDVTVILVDPLVSYIGGRVDMYRANETRAALEPLVDLAQKTGTTVVMVRHLRKNKEGDRRMAGLGSIDFYAHARSVIQVEEDHGGTLINNIKNNYAKHGTRIVYTIADNRLSWGRYFRPGEGLKVSRVSRRAGEYQDWLRAQLAGGPKSAGELEERAAFDGLSWPSIRQSAKGVAFSYKGKGKDGGWWWALEKGERPPEPDDPLDDTPVFDAGAVAAAIRARKGLQ